MHNVKNVLVCIGDIVINTEIFSFSNCHMHNLLNMLFFTIAISYKCCSYSSVVSDITTKYIQKFEDTKGAAFGFVRYLHQLLLILFIHVISVSTFSRNSLDLRRSKRKPKGQTKGEIRQTRQSQAHEEEGTSHLYI